MTTRNKRNSLSSAADIPMKKSDDGSSQEEDMSDPKWAHHQGAAALRFSARVVEKQEKLLQKQVPVHPNLEPQSLECEPSVSDVSLRNSKKKRNWTLWSSDDKQYFFEGLNEFGKDFDAIQNHISLKLKSKRSPTTTKNKDQVRHFYYRTWNKISKFLTFPEMKKAHQELYGLINYGELRKKQRVLNLKTAVKLSELVQKGSTTIKVRGKTFRIKTPVCRALKKLNRLEEPESKLPNKVIVELLPQNGQAWVYVQNLSYNPRVRVHLSLQRSLASVIKFFEDRWKGTDVKMKEQLLQTFGKAIPRLRFIPQGFHHHLPHFKVLEATSASKISLRNYTDSMLRSTYKAESGGDDHENDNDTEDERMGVPEQRHHTPSAGSSAELHHSSINLSQRHEEEEFLEKCNLSSPSDCSKGWTSEEAGMITLGEVYVMLGSCSTLHFEYKWDSYERSLSHSLISKVIAVSNLLKKKKCYKTKVGGAQCPNCGYSSGACPSTSSKCVDRQDHASDNVRHQVSFNLEQAKGTSPTIHVPLQFFPTLTPPSTGSQPQQGSSSAEPQNKSIILLPKGNRRAGRPANRKVIVPRVLPLLPKIDPSTTPIFTVTTTQNVLNTVHQQGQLLSPGTSASIHKQLNAAMNIAKHQQPSPVLLASETATSLTPSEFNDLIQLKSSANISENSSFSLSSFLDMTLPSPEPATLGTRGSSSGSCLTSDKFLSCDDNSLLNLLDCKQTSDSEKKSEENLLSNGPWLTSESNDLSLSSLLGNLDGNSVDASQLSAGDNARNASGSMSSYLNDDDG